MWLWWWGCVGPAAGPGAATGDTAAAVETMRVATWNIEQLGAPGSAQYAAAAQVLARIDADVVGLNEIREGEENDLVGLALDLGYEVVQPNTNPFGSNHNAMLSRLPLREEGFPSSAALAGDPNANDVTRWPVTIVVTAPWGHDVAITVQHCKSGFGITDQFRRLVDAHRTGQAATREAMVSHIAMGDINEDRRELQTEPPSPAQWTFPPGGLPVDYVLGADIEARLSEPGLVNDPFERLETFGLSTVDAQQGDGRTATRDSGRLIDYVFLDEGLQAEASEIYDSQDEAFPDQIVKAGEPLARAVSRTAADHLPVIVDVRPR